MEPKKDIEIVPNIVKPGYSYWLCGYIINLEGMKKVINSNFKKNLMMVKYIILVLNMKLLGQTISVQKVFIY